MGISYALFITGNPGVGKSYIANNLGASFLSGFALHGGGVTTNIQKEEVTINGEHVLLVDAPGLVEVDLVATRRNAQMISEALRIGHNIPCKLALIVADHNGRIQQADMLLIRKIHEALTPKFDILLIVNQVKRRNIRHYTSDECLNSLVNTINSITGTSVDRERLVVIPEDEGGWPNMEPMKQKLQWMSKNTVRNVQNITVSNEEFASVGEQILFYTFAVVAALTSPIWGIPYLIVKAFK
ncbi:hypothetical protein BX616_002243 [Lobosporangium transversale]|uniref:G domain-containing protein n=1 Tax=Lobosporangium transversale TaxID=64571 RepID=A0A1Y2GHK3_9FUNG|nr:hypothetical protein BCR41DRAFT_358013 [Lobosporangium transversale]KAF9916987.1 hypothetical protein BX616_002243 [Lobosporangium transversale]ORZ09964.1 hypothetical protein BCR41DRAFT_358013 [Lobosporangium transversale]|eukprot:XP_021879054.1 hypothetical protein BCR41DRAFT_358013 [Lobosporangium transversale]